MVRLQQEFATSEMGSGLNLHGSNPEPLMSALGQKQTCAAHKLMSALHPIADMCGAARDVRYGPIADIPSPSNKRGSARQNDPDFGELARPSVDLD